MEKFVMTTQEAANYLGIGINQVRALVREGEIPAFQSGKNFKIVRHHLEKWASEKAERESLLRRRPSNQMDGPIEY